MRHYLKKLIIVAIAFYVAYTVVPTISFGIDYKNIAIVIVGLFAASFILRTVFSLILIPANIVTMLLVSLVLNAGLLFAYTFFLPGFTIAPYNFPGINYQGIIIQAVNFNSIGTILLIAAIITLAQKVLHFIFE